MSCPLVDLPIVTSFVISGCLRAVAANSSLRPPGPAYFLKTLRPAAAWAVARWVTVWPSISFGVSVTPSPASSAACSPLRIVSTWTEPFAPALAADRSS
jgi:hypothetical protein